MKKGSTATPACVKSYSEVPKTISIWVGQEGKVVAGRMSIKDGRRPREDRAQKKRRGSSQ